MEERKIKKSEEQDEVKKKKDEKKLPYCTTAPSPEHARAYDEDEPCDDSTAGDVEID
jgi:hypothetical protein